MEFKFLGVSAAGSHSTCLLKITDARQSRHCSDLQRSSSALGWWWQITFIGGLGRELSGGGDRLNRVSLVTVD